MVADLGAVIRWLDDERVRADHLAAREENLGTRRYLYGRKQALAEAAQRLSRAPSEAP
jgi:hypothetical protein